jgi:hypothetical protein
MILVMIKSSIKYLLKLKDKIALFVGKRMFISKKKKLKEF